MKVEFILELFYLLQDNIVKFVLPDVLLIGPAQKRIGMATVIAPTPTKELLNAKCTCHEGYVSRCVHLPDYARDIHVSMDAWMSVKMPPIFLYFLYK